MVIKNLRKALEISLDLYNNGKCVIDGVELDFIPNLTYVTVGDWRVFLEEHGEMSLWFKGRPVASHILEQEEIDFIEDDEVYENGLYPSVFETINICLYDNSKDFSKDRRRLEELYNYDKNHRRKSA